MAPEVAQHRPYAYPADVYSYAVCAWQIALWQAKPFTDKTPAEAIAATISGGRPSLLSLERVDPALAQLIVKCWCHDPEDRCTFGVVNAALGQEKDSEEHLRIAQQYFNLVGGSASECGAFYRFYPRGRSAGTDCCCFAAGSP